MRLKKILLIVFILLFFNNYLQADFQSMAMKAALDIITKPNEFFMEINTDIEDISPNHSDDRGRISFSLFSFPWTVTELAIANIQFKYRALEDTGTWPEITPGLSYWNFWALYLIPKDVFSGSAQGCTPFITISKKFQKNIKLFTGAKYAIGSINLDAREALDSGGSGSYGMDISSIANVKSIYQEFSFYTGINYLKVGGNEIIAMIGYYPGVKKLYSKVQLSTSSFDYGICMYPDSALFWHAFMNIHIDL